VTISDRAARDTLVALARGAIASALGLESPPVPPHPILDQRRGTFVTLTQRHRLRGCIGHVAGDRPVRALVPRVAHEAAFEDPRFPPLSAAEFPGVLVEISLLGAPTPVASPEAVVVGTHGVIVHARGRRGLLLPQVATEWNWTRDELLSHACDKAGLSPDAWRSGEAAVEVFTADIYPEEGG
jgi:AmmeMemoRadiSam system protein A